MSIEGVVVTPLTTRVDDRGYLTEVLRATDDTFTKFGQMYVVGDIKAGTIRAFHKHDILWDWFFISHGTAKFVLWDGRVGPDYKKTMTVITGERNPVLLTIPPGVFHGWMALDDDVQLVSVASEVYNHDNPDEVRVDPYVLGDVWTVKGK